MSRTFKDMPLSVAVRKGLVGGTYRGDMVLRRVVKRTEVYGLACARDSGVVSSLVRDARDDAVCVMERDGVSVDVRELRVFLFEDEARLLEGVVAGCRSRLSVADLFSVFPPDFGGLCLSRRSRLGVDGDVEYAELFIVVLWVESRSVRSVRRGSYDMSVADIRGARNSHAHVDWRRDYGWQVVREKKERVREFVDWSD